MRYSGATWRRGGLGLAAGMLLLAGFLGRGSFLASAPELVRVPAPLTAPVASAAGWPNFLGPGRDSVAHEAGLIDTFAAEGPPELWRREIGAGYSSPIVDDRGLIVFHRVKDQEIIECFDPESGRSRWRHDSPTAYVCKFEYSNGPYSTPTLEGQFVYACGAEGKLRCVRVADGSLEWWRDLRADFAPTEGMFPAAASPLVDAQRVYLPVGGTRGNSGIVAFDKQTGATLWTATDHERGYASPVKATMHGREFLFVFDKFGLSALDPALGTLYWEIPFTSRVMHTVCGSSPLVHEDLVLVTMGPGPGALCVRVLPSGAYEEAWRDRRVLDSTWNNVVLHQGQLFGFTSKQQRTKLRSLDMRTGKMSWEWESELERGSLVAADGKLFVCGEHGHLALFDLDSRACRLRCLTAEPLLPTPCYAMPALHRGRLYLRNDNTLLCLDVRRPGATASAGEE